jgi:hypothetical protein
VADYAYVWVCGKHNSNLAEVIVAVAMDYTQQYDNLSLNGYPSVCSVNQVLC